jgi:hypothetical protein
MATIIILDFIKVSFKLKIISFHLLGKERSKSIKEFNLKPASLLFHIREEDRITSKGKGVLL